MKFLIGKSNTRSNSLWVAAIILAWGASGAGLFANDGMASNAIVHRAGLKVQWFTHSGAALNGGLVDWHLNINENNARTFYTITAGNYHETFSQDKIDAFGKPLGADGAMEYADIRKDILLAELASDGRKDVDVVIGQYSLPETTIYLLTNTGDIRAVDGDSGATKWSTRIGSPDLPSIGVGSNDDYVAAVNGSTLYCLESKTGKVIWSRQCQYAVGASPAISEESIYVPLLNGRLELFSIKDKGFASRAFVAKGEGTARPLITEKTVAWPNSRGTMSVAAKFGKSGLAYQLLADDAIVSPVTFKNGMLFITSLDGFVYAIEEDRGAILWQVSTGNSISESPIPLGDFVFVINDANELFKFNATTGEEAPGWEKPQTGVQRFVGAGKDNLYVLDPFGTLKVISQSSGTTISSVSFGDVDLVLANLQSDRLYVSSKQGMIQCVREVASAIPYFHSGEFMTVDNEAPRQKAAPTTKPGADSTDPFGDPFGSSNDSSTKNSDSVDPFGGQPSGADKGNPFGGDSKDDAKSDPFGGDAGADGKSNPFGGASGADSKPSSGSGDGGVDPFGG